ncbi:hypothetical protein GCM10010441_67410 [Kitasatospora paracochleata]|uniref:ABC transporter permease n=1 Tax=Kitasatospora paracochleata TaxID=58354 RepID=A0ABT1J7H4_9ACTN|nr:hypothetical protein [Kitasatospora paracochleata]MCP2312671.1 hypothetical protein [Kitasatospora paracochleata]
MTVPNTPTGSPAGQDPFAAPPPYLPEPERKPREIAPEFRIGLLLVAVSLVLGVALGLLWLWLAPRVMFEVSDNRILYVDPEGEERIGADGMFALLGLGFGVLSALGTFLFTRTRGGGISTAVGLAVGGLAGSVLGWKLGMRLGPTSDLRAHALQVGNGHRFSGAIELGAHSALLVWPMSAMVVLLLLHAAFGKREQDPPPYWASPQWPAPPAHPAQSPFLPPTATPPAHPAPGTPGTSDTPGSSGTPGSDTPPQPPA